jgi:hypothetical protein
MSGSLAGDARKAEPASCLRFNRSAPLPVAEDVPAAYSEPGPDRFVRAWTKSAATPNQPREHLVCRIEGNVLAGTVLLEVTHAAQRVPVIEHTDNLRIAPQQLKELAVALVLAAHHLQTNTPFGL